MPPKRNPLKLNGLQRKTLAILQEVAGLSEFSRPDEAGGGITFLGLPQPHGDHFHIGDKGVMASNATGLQNQAVWTALSRKGLVAPGFPMVMALTGAGVAYDTGIREKIILSADH